MLRVLLLISTCIHYLYIFPLNYVVSCPNQMSPPPSLVIFLSHHLLFTFFSCMSIFVLLNSVFPFFSILSRILFLSLFFFLSFSLLFLHRSRLFFTFFSFPQLSRFFPSRFIFSCFFLSSFLLFPSIPFPFRLPLSHFLSPSLFPSIPSEHLIREWPGELMWAGEDQFKQHYVNQRRLKRKGREGAGCIPPSLPPRSGAILS